MPAPEGNRFWEQRSKHGRDTLFASPTLMWEAAKEYFEWCIDNPFEVEKAFVVSGGKDMGSSIEKTDLTQMRPFTMEGLCLYLGTNTEYFIQFAKSKTAKENEEFSQVIKNIRETVKNQQVSGAMAGLLKENIVSRVNGLKDRQDVTTDDQPMQPITGMRIEN